MAMTFSDGALLRQGWQTTKEKFGFLLAVMIVVILVVVGFAFLSGFVAERSLGLYWLMFFVQLAIEFMIGIGLIRIALALARGKKADFSLLYKGYDVLLKYVLVTLLYAVIVIVGLFLFIIPGIIWSIKFMWAPWLVIDKGMGPMAALRASAKMTDGLKWDLLGFHILTQIVVLLGIIALLVGTVVAVPVTMIATAALYDKLAKGKS